MTVRLYRFDTHLQIIEEGAVTLHDALLVLHECLNASGRTYECGEEAIAATCFGLARTEDDFLEAVCHGKGQIAFHTDFIHASAIRTSFWKRLFGRDRYIDWECDQASADRVVADYFHLTRLDFESKYAQQVP